MDTIELWEQEIEQKEIKHQKAIEEATRYFDKHFGSHDINTINKIQRIIDVVREASVTKDKYGNWNSGVKIKGTNIFIHVFKGKPDKEEANSMIKNIKSEAKIIEKDWDNILDQVAKHHMDYAKNALNSMKDDTKSEYGKLAKKYADSVESNKKCLKLNSISYDGPGMFTITFDSDLINKDGHTAFVETSIKNGKVQVNYVTFEG